MSHQKTQAKAQQSCSTLLAHQSTGVGCDDKRCHTTKNTANDDAAHDIWYARSSDLAQGHTYTSDSHTSNCCQIFKQHHTDVGVHTIADCMKLTG